MKTTHERFPRDNGSRESLVADAVDDFRERCARGEQPDVAEHAARFPQVADELRRLLPALVALDAAGLDSEDGTPSALGDFRIQREVGRGGMAVVYEAEQLSLGRRVALKVLPFAAVMDPRQLQRFKNEAQAAAHLHHGHIVPVHSVGCERGVHYYAMQYIEGLSIAQMIDELGALAGRDMSAESSSAAVQAVTRGKATKSAAYCRAVARLGIQAAEALDHAHQQGVVHRDIKPANLLVDASGHLWITDFGLASFTSQPGLTMTGDIVGTVRYMSPEQALAKRVPIDHRTDIYSLGVTLYELLTLQVAFSGDDPHRVIQEIAFTEPKPARSLNAAVPDELETILIKAMAKDPGERFATAQELADDLARYLAHKPIHARRPTLVQRAGKWARRHAALVWGVAAVLMLAVAGLVTGAALLWREQGRTETAYKALSREQARTEQQRERAEATLGLALEALDDVYLDEAEIRPTLRPDLSRDLLEKGLGFYEQFAAENANNPKVGTKAGTALARAGLIYRRLGRNDEAEKAFHAAVHRLSDAVRNRPDSARTHWGLGIALRETGELDGAIAAFREVIRLAPAHAGAHVNLGVALVDKGLVDEGIGAYREAIRLAPDFAEAHTNLGSALDQVGRHDEALAAHRHAVRIAPKLAIAHANLGGALRQLGLYDEAIAACRQALRLEPGLAVAHSNLGAALCKKGLPDEAVAACREAIRRDPASALAHSRLGLALEEKGLLDEAIAAHCEAIRLQPDLAVAHVNLGAVLCDRKHDFDGAIAAFREAIRLEPDCKHAHFNLGNALKGKGLLEDALAAYREAIRLEPDHAKAHSSLGYALLRTGRLDEAIAALREAIRLDPKSAVAHGNLGTAHHARGQLDEAIAAYREAIRLKPDFGYAHNSLGTALFMKGSLDAAISVYREAIRVDPNNAEAHFNLGLAFRRKGILDEAIAAQREAIRLKPDHARAHSDLGAALCDGKHDFDGAISAFREAIRLEPNWALAHSNLGVALGKKGLPERAIAAYREAIRLDPNSARAYYGLAWTLATCAQEKVRNPDQAVALAKKAASLALGDADVFNTLGVAHYRAEQFEEAVDALERSMRLKKGGDPHDWLFVAMAKWHLGDLEDARAFQAKARAWMKEHASDDPELKRFAAEAAELIEAEKKN